MTDSETKQDAEPKDKAARKAARKRLPAWKKALVLVSLALTLVGGGFWGYESMAGPGGGAKTVASQQAPGTQDEGDGTQVPSTGLAPSDNGGTSWPGLPRLPGDHGPTEPGGTSGEESSQGTTEAAEPQPGGEGETLWPAALFRLGFGFFVGFCIGYAVRTFVRISFVAIGLVLLTLFGLQYAGVIAVDWSAMESIFDNAVAWLRTNLAGFRGFVTGQLPSAAAGIGGAVLGFRK